MIAEDSGGLAGAVRAQLHRSLSWLLPLAILALALAIKATEAFGIPASLRAFFVSLILRVVYDAPAEELRRPEMADATELMFLAVTGVVLVVLFARRSVFSAGTAMAAALSAFSLFAWGMALRWGALFDVFSIGFALACVFAAGVATHGAGRKEDRERLRLLAGQFSAAASAALTGRAELDELAPQRRDITYLVCRIRDYSTQADTADAERLVDSTRRLLALLERVARQHEGTIDRVMPDGLSCMFNAPLADREAEMRACNCALAMSDAAQRLSRSLAAELSEGGAISIGINSGVALVGDFGSMAQPRYGAAGRIVDAAFDLERIAGQYGAGIAVGESVRARVERHLALLELDLVPRAANAPLAIYHLLGGPAVRSSPKFRALQAFHQRIFQAYRARDWTRARVLVAQCRALSTASIRLYDFYLERVAYYEAHPPGDVWDGTFRRASAFAEAPADSLATLARRSFSVGGSA